MGCCMWALPSRTWLISPYRGWAEVMKLTLVQFHFSEWSLSVDAGLRTVLLGIQWVLGVWFLSSSSCLHHSVSDLVMAFFQSNITWRRMVMVNYWMCLLMDFKAVGRAVFLGKERAEQFVNRERSWCLARLQRGVLGPPGHTGGAGVQPGTWLQVVSSLRLLWVFLREGKRYPLRGFCVEIVHLIKHQGWKTEVFFLCQFQ